MLSAKNAWSSLSSVLKARPDRSATWPFSVRAQPFSEITTVTGSRSTKLLDGGEIVLGRVGELGAALAKRRLRPEQVAHLAHLLADLRPLLGFGTENTLDAFQFGPKVLVLGADLEFLELAQGAQPHVEDGVGLDFRQLERLDQGRLRLVLGADDLDHLVDVEVGDQIAAEHLEPVLDLLLAVVGAAQQHVAQMVEPLSQAFGEAEHLGDAALDQHVEVQRNPAFQLGQPEQRFHQQLRIDRARLRLDHKADVFGRFIVDVADQRQLLFIEQFGDLFHQPGFLHQPWNFGDDHDPAAAGALFLHPSGAGAERAAPSHIRFGDALLGIDNDAAGREIRALHPFQQRLRLRLGLVDQMQRRVAEFGGVVRRDRGGHADPRCPARRWRADWKTAGQHDRLFRLTVVIGAEFDAVLVDAFEQQPCDLGHARFGVTVGGGVIAVDIAEIALAVDQRIARGKILGEAHQRVVDRLVAMRMERAHHVADDLGGFLERRAGVEPQQPHAVEDAAVHRLQPVARIGQRAVHDGRQRIGEIALFERVAQPDLVDFGRLWRNQCLSHGEELSGGGVMDKARVQCNSSPLAVVPANAGRSIHTRSATLGRKTQPVF